MRKIEEFLTESELKKYVACNSAGGRYRVLNKAARRSFKLLVFILGYRDVGEFHNAEMERISEVKIIGKKSRRRIWLWHRGAFKTSLIIEAHSIYLIINNVNIRILLASNTIGIAEKILKNIKDHFIRNESFRKVFSEFCPVANQFGKIDFGTSEQFTVPNRTTFRKEPTMMVAGVGTNLTGLHFDYHKLDDLVTPNSVTNDTQIQTSKDYYSSLRQLFDNPVYPMEDVVGTIYHFNDLYCDMKKSGLYKESFIPIKDKKGEITFHERFSEDSIEELLRDPMVGPYTYQTQYMLNPVNPEKAKFKSEWISDYDVLPEGLREYICVDPASKKKKKSDYTVIERWGIDNNGYHYLLEGIRDKLSSYERIDLLFEFVLHSKNLVWVKYEVLGGRHGDLEIIENKKREKQVFFDIKETKSTTSSKEDRIEQRLVGPYHSKIILWPRTMVYRSKYDGKVKNFIEEFKLELLQFPFSEHDDILDCHSQMFEEPSQLIKGKKIIDKIQKKELTADDWEKFYKELDKIKNNTNNLTNEQALLRLKARRLKRALNNSPS